MYRYFFYMVFVVLFAGCKGEQATALTCTDSFNRSGVEIPVYDFEGLTPLLNRNDGKTRIINFWATWCKPCIVELPYFELLNSRYPNDKVEVILVSLDLPNQVESRLIPFVKKQNIQSKVVLLDDPDANSWIPKVDREWTGAIPATIIYKGRVRRFYEQSFTYNELEKELKKIL